MTEQGIPRGRAILASRRWIRDPRPVPDEPEESGDEPVIVPIEDSIDLHSFAPRDVVSVVESYLEAAAERGFREVRLIHGRGKGAQRASVQRRLRGHPLVEEFFDAPPERGGWGATVVRLRGPTNPLPPRSSPA